MPMSKKNNHEIGSSLVDLSIQIRNCVDRDKNIIMELPSVNQKSVMSAMKNIADGYKESMFTGVSSSDTVTSNGDNSAEEDSRVSEGIPMTSDISRSEIEALLKANKAEVDIVAASMREDMAKWRETQNAQINQLNTILSGLSSKIDSKFEIIDSKIDSVEKSLNAKFDGIDKSLNAKVDGISESINGKIEGLNTAITGMQSGMSTKLTKFGIAIGSVVTIIAAVAGVGISLMTSTPTNQNAQQLQPTVIYVQQPVTEKSIIQSTQEPPTQKTSNSSK